MTLQFLLHRYNANYLDVDEGEPVITENVLKHIMLILTEQAKLVEQTSRKVRLRMKNGNYHIRQSIIYHITSSGIEYLNLMQKVVDAENTVTANINQINEYCNLIDLLADQRTETQSTKFYNYFAQMLNTYDDVMKGMHKLDNDLDQLINDLNFNHGSKEAKQLQTMINEKAIPAFQQLLAKAPKIQTLANSESFRNRVAYSQQGEDDLDTARAINDQHAITQRFRQTQAYVKRQLDRLAKSLDPSTSAIDNSLDSVYLLFNTILKAIQILSQEYEHIKNQTIDLKALTSKIDQLLTDFKSLNVPAQLPRHLAQDRLLADPSDLLDASTMGPVEYVANIRIKKIATENDNPIIVDDHLGKITTQTALDEIKELIMRDDLHAVIDHDLEFKTKIARDEIVRLYSATRADHYDSFAPFGRNVLEVRIIPEISSIRLHCAGEMFSVFLPQGFEISFAEGKI
ncbi:hypothetical protein XA3_09300 [Xylocopilactobacillus apicola]|uniref:Uncharacterized protein n=1 Tax=Xylocopilactobacillus apicola TaxID=2932184 RepID=A0AAU9DRC1_9LACO|nr:hypothetical protein XA3_09300 [Xylocopilactobacillus apicola]